MNLCNYITDKSKYKTRKNVSFTKPIRPPYYKQLMEKIEIINKVHKIKTVSDFANLLDEIKKDEFGTPLYKITEEQLLHFCNSRIVPNRYKKFHIKKKNGKLREINAPCYQLKVLLYITNIVLKALYTPSESVMGFTEGRSIVDNARMHVGHNYILNIDLENFFPSIPQPRVWARLQVPPFNLPLKVANVVAGLCCTPNEEGSQNILPQGAPTSPLLTNAICDTLDRRMRGVAKRYGIHYSRYADDMTFSSMHNVYQEDGEFMKEVKRIIEEQGFKMNDDKTRLFRESERQEVTGLTVNKCVNVARKYVRDLRCLLHVWEKEGYAKAYSYFYPIYKRDKGYIKKGEPVMENVIGGKLNYLAMVKGNKNQTYLKLLDRFNKLQQVVFVDSDTDKNQNYIYVQPYTMAEFQKYFCTEMFLEVTSKNKLVGICSICGMDKVISISKTTQDYLCPQRTTMTPGERVKSRFLQECYVTLCRAKGKNFWLITKSLLNRSKCMSIQNVQIDVDNLLKLWEVKGVEFAASYFHEAIMSGTPIPSLEELGLLPQKSQKPLPLFLNDDGNVIDYISLEDIKLVEEEIKNGGECQIGKSPQNDFKIVDF